MHMRRVEAPLPFASHLVIRLLRRWCAQDPLQGSRLPALVRLAGRLDIEAEAAVALASVFELTEACLGRRLEPECCCSPRLSRDEHAVLRLLAAAPPHQSRTSPDIPHGLPGALVWAVASVRRLLGEPAVPNAKSGVRECPFRSEPPDSASLRPEARTA